MTAFLLQTLLWLVVAFLLGLFLGLLIKKWLCKSDDKGITSTSLDSDERNTGLLNKTSITGTTTGIAAAGTAATAGIASAKAKIGNLKDSLPDAELPTIDPPTIDAANVTAKLADVADVELPKTNMDVDSSAVTDTLKGASLAAGAGIAAKVAAGGKAPDLSVDTDTPEVDTELSGTGFNIDVAEVDGGAALPEVSVETELLEADLSEANISIDTPDISVDAELSEVELADIDVGTELPEVELPEVNVAIDTELPEVDLPEIDVDGAAIKLAATDIDANIELPDGDGITTKIADAVGVDLPEVDGADIAGQVANAVGVDLPEVDGVDIAGQVADAVGVDLPEMDIAGGSGIADAVKGAALAAGAGLAAKAGAAMASDGQESAVQTDAADGEDGASPTIKLPVVKDDDEIAEQAALDAEAIQRATDAEEDGGYMHRVASSQVKLPQVKAEVPEAISVSETSAEQETTALNTGTADPQVKLPVAPIEAVAADHQDNETDNTESTEQTAQGSSDTSDGIESAGLGSDGDAVSVESTVQNMSGDGNSSITDTLSNAAIATGAAAVTAQAATAFAGDGNRDNDTAEVSASSMDASAGEAYAEQLNLSDISAIRAAMADQSTKHGIQVLWNPGEGQHRCQDLTSKEKVVLTSGQYDKVGSIHCGVTRAGFVAVGGYVSDVDDGQAILFVKSQVVACRHGDEHTFLYFADL